MNERVKKVGPFIKQHWREITFGASLFTFTGGTATLVAIENQYQMTLKQSDRPLNDSKDRYLNDKGLKGLQGGASWVVAVSGVAGMWSFGHKMVQWGMVPKRNDNPDNYN